MTDHKGTLLDLQTKLTVWAALEESEHVLADMAKMNDRLDALIEAVPSEIRFQRCDYDVHDLPILRIAAKLLHEATTEKEERCKDTEEMF